MASAALLAVVKADATPFFWAAAVAFGAYLVLFAVIVAATRPRTGRAGPETGDLGPEPPAVVNLLTGRCRVTSTAISATLLDLAARRLLDVEQTAPNTFLVRLFRNRSAVANETLTPYEASVIQLVEREAAADGTVAVPELSLGAGPAAEGWWKRFCRDVEKDARSRGLIRRRLSGLAGAALVLGLAVPAGLGGIGLEIISAANRATGTTRKGDDAGGGAAIAAVAWFVLIGAGGSRLRAYRDTPTGRDVAGRWLGVRDHLRASDVASVPPSAVAVWERRLAYATALGVAHEADRALPIGPQRDDEAWSAYTGLWRALRIRYPRRFGYGNKPGAVLATGLFWIAFAAGFGIAVWRAVLPILRDAADRVRDNATTTLNPWVDRGLTIGIAVIVAIPGLWFLVRLIRGVIMVGKAVPDLGEPLTYEGQVVRVTHRPGAKKFGQSERPMVRYVAIDDGQDDELRGLVYTGIAAEGDVVRVTHTRRLGHVRSLDVLHDRTKAATWSAPTRLVADVPDAPDGPDRGPGFGLGGRY